jgi:small subunit ribosomal protein S5|tara:strand:- start:1996 stop:2826 length:831 start_codon:yes stop_codon:yes gene_type:complete
MTELEKQKTEEEKETEKIIEVTTKIKDEGNEVTTKIMEVGGKEEVPEKPKEEKGNSKKPWKRDDTVDISGWEPKTKLGKEVKDGNIKNIDEILDKKRKILESEIVDSLITVKTELVNIGQSKGKFGGGKRRIWRQTQRKTKEGNVPKFSTLAIVGDENGHVGVGTGKSKETLPAREKSIRKAKINIIKIKRDCSGFDCSCDNLHTVPLRITGKAGSVKVTLIPASQGTGLVVANELKKILRLAGIKDVYSRTSGKKRTTFNLIKACFDALKKTNIK